MFFGSRFLVFACFSFLLFRYCYAEPYFYSIYNWNHFCPEHLTSDPEGCSSWTIEDNACILEEKTDYGPFPFSYIDQDLIDQVKEMVHLIPIEASIPCMYGICEKCGEKIRQTLDYQVEEIVDEFEGTIFVSKFETFYKCGCLQDFIALTDFSEITKWWHFCHKPTIYSGYFDKYLSLNFQNFKTYLNYCKSNSFCHCSSPIISSKVANILDAFIGDFFEKFLSSGLVYSVYTDFEFIKLHKITDMPYRKLLEQFLHCYFYSDLAEALKTFDPNVFDIFSDDNDRPIHIDLNEYAVFCEETLEKLRPQFLELYRACYAKHPHPRIASEIALILSEIIGTSVIPHNSANVVTPLKKEQLRYLQRGNLLFRQRIH